MSSAERLSHARVVHSDTISDSLHYIFRGLMTGEESTSEEVAMTQKDLNEVRNVDAADIDESASLSSTGDRYDAELKSIFEHYKAHLSGVENHERHLVEEMERARENERLADLERDKSYTELHREVGLPMQRSLFRMSPSYIAEFSLVNPYSLVSEQESNDLERRTMPRRTMFKGSESNVGRPTKVQTERRIEVTHSLSAASMKTLARKAIRGAPETPSVSSSEMKRPTSKMGSDQWDEEMRVLKSMSSRLSF